MAEKEYVEREATCKDCFHYDVCNYHITEETCMTVLECSHKFVNKADVVEVQHGKWVLHADGSGTCDQCNTTQKNVWDFDNWQNYCGHCGADMRGVNDVDL